MRIAVFSPPCSRAAAATRTLPRTASHMPVKPVTAENSAPMTKKTDRPIRSPVESAGQEQQDERDQDDEDRDRSELAFQIGACTYLYRSRDLLHLVGALASGQDIAHETRGDGQCEQRDHGDDDDQGEVAAAEIHFCAGRA